MNARACMLLLILVSAAILPAEEAREVPDVATPASAAPDLTAEETLPTGFPLTRYTAIWENSPFTREVIPAVAKTIESRFAQSLVLEGVINDDEKGPVAYVRDTREDKSLVITTAKNDSHPFTIVSAKQAHRPEDTKITLTDGNETGEIGFQAASLTQAIAQPVAVAAPQKNPGKSDPRGGLRPGQNPQQGSGQVPGNAGGGGQPGGFLPGMPNAPAIGTAAASGGTPASATPALDAIDSEPRRRRVPLPGAPK